MTEVVEEIVVTAKRTSPAVFVVVIVPPNNYPFSSSQAFLGIDIPSQSTVYTDNSVNCWTALTGGVGYRSGWFNEPRSSGPHKGLDIAAIAGTGVYAARSGWVVEATPLKDIVGPGEMGTYGNAANGNYVRIQDVHGGIHSYIHLQSVNVTVGEWVNSDQDIGRVNNELEYAC